MKTLAEEYGADTDILNAIENLAVVCLMANADSPIEIKLSKATMSRLKDQMLMKHKFSDPAVRKSIQDSTFFTTYNNPAGQVRIIEAEENHK